MRVFTRSCYFCNNSSNLLGALQKESGNLKTVVIYGESNTVLVPNRRKFAIIHIARHNKEYKGYLNIYQEK